MRETDQFQYLVEKLDQFIRKYYLNQLIKGGMITAALVLGFFLSVVTLEYFFYFDIPIRAILFYSFAALTAGVLWKYIVVPGVKWMKLGNTISYEKAGGIIGKHFPEVHDKVTNTLQLKKLADQHPQQAELILAGIEQKIKDLKPVPFQMAIDLKANKKYVKYAAIPLLVLVLLAFTTPGLLYDGTTRLVKHYEKFEKPLPFHFSIQNQGLEALKNEDFELNVKTEGKVVPDQAYISFGDNRYKLRKTGPGNFSFTFKNLQQSVDFQLSAQGIGSGDYRIDVLPKPMIISLQADLDFPGYLNRKNESVRNNGDLTVPEGTEVKWRFEATDVDSLMFVYDSTRHPAKRLSETTYDYQGTFEKSTYYTVKAKNSATDYAQDVEYALTVVPDKYPSIQLDKLLDTLTQSRIYFSGQINDDHGFSRLAFNYTVDGQKKTEAVNINTGITQQNFYHTLDLGKLGLEPGTEVSYFFEVWDNDGVNGSKSTKTNIQTYNAPSLKEIAEMGEKKNEKVKEELEAALKETQQLQQQIDDFSKKLIDKKKMGWEEKEQLKSLVKQRESLEKKVDNLKSKNKEKNELQNQLQKPSEELLEKQKKLEELFENLMDEEMKKLMEEMEKLMENMDKKQLQEQMEDFQLSNEDMEKELDRTLEIFKQFEFEQKLQQSIDQLKKLKEEQKELKEETESSKSGSEEELSKEQEELNKKSEDLEKSIEDLKKKNGDLENKHEVPDVSKEMEEMKEEMKDASEQLKQKQRKKANESQQNSMQQMDQMQQKLEKFQSGMQMQQRQENLEDMRALLENLLQLSFDQEELMEQVKGLQRNDPKFVEANQQQRKIKDNAAMIEDSLFALSKRVPEIESTVNSEMNEINSNMDKAIQDLVDRNSGKAANRQQLIMTSLNDLALLFDEIVQNMQQQMSGMKFGKKSCNKPGSGMPKSMSDMKKAQQQLNKQMKKMLEKMKQGQKPGGKKPGGKGSEMSKEIAKMAAEQAAIREAIRKMQQGMENEKGTKPGGNLEKMQEMMEKTEEELVNMQLSRESIRRQEEIMTKMLESEKAEREQEYQKARESKEADQMENRAEKIFLEYQEMKEKELELLKTVPPNLNSYYKNKVSQYFNDI